jgi:hypothetical protein
MGTNLTQNSESISPNNLCNALRCHDKVNGAKYAILFQHCFFKNLIACLRLPLLLSLQYFGTFLQKGLTIKRIKNYLRKSCSSLALKMLMKWTIK